MSQAAHGSQLLVDGVCGQPQDFKVQPVVHDYDAVEGHPWVEHRQFAVIRIWKPKHSATVIRLDSALPMATACHAAGLEPRHRPRAMQPLSLGTGWRGFERLWLVKKSTRLGVKNSPTMKSSGLSVGIGPGSRILYRVIPPVVGLEGLERPKDQ